jgi:CheY-like chemotaxis protein
VPPAGLGCDRTPHFYGAKVAVNVACSVYTRTDRCCLMHSNDSRPPVTTEAGREVRIVKEWILIIEDRPVLLQTRTELLQNWQIVTASSRDAGEAIQARAYDLLIFSQTVLEETANRLISRARAVNPQLNVLAISAEEQERSLASATYRVDLSNPNGLRIAVARLLSMSGQNPAHRTCSHHSKTPKIKVLKRFLIEAPEKSGYR